MRLRQLKNIYEIDRIPSSNYYEPKIPYGIFPRTPYLEFEARILKNYDQQPVSILLNPTDTNKAMKCFIAIGDGTPFPMAEGKDKRYKNLLPQEQHAIILHEIYHLLINFHQLMLPYEGKIIDYDWLKHFIPPGFFNIIDDFMVDAVGTPLQTKDLLVKAVTRGVELDKWHYYNSMQATKRHTGQVPDGTLESQIIDYLYGNLLEGEGTYPPPLLCDKESSLLQDYFMRLTSNIYNPNNLTKQQLDELFSLFDKLNSMFIDALDTYRNGIKQVRDMIANNEHATFWNDKTLLSGDTQNEIIRQLVAVMKEFSEKLGEIEQFLTATFDAPYKPELYDIFQHISTNYARERRNQERESSVVKYDSVSSLKNGEINAFIDQPNNPYRGILSTEALSDAFKQREKLSKEKEEKEALDETPNDEKIINIERNKAEEETEALISEKYPEAVNSLAKQVFKKMVSAQKLKHLSRVSSLNNGYLVISEELSKRGRLDVREVTRQFPAIASGKTQTPDVYRHSSIVHINKLKLMVVFDVSCSMNTINQFLKPFFSKFYAEYLSNLFKVEIVDFSETVIKENQSLLKEQEYYSEIRNEMYTEPLSEFNLKTWNDIVHNLKPDIVLVYSDGAFQDTAPHLLKTLPPEEQSEDKKIHLLNALSWYISKQGVKRENIKAFCTDFYGSYGIERLAKDSLTFIDKVVEREIINRAKTPKLEMER